MKTLALTTLVATLTLVGCGGGSNEDTNSFTDTNTMPSTPTTPVEPSTPTTPEKKFTLSSNVMSDGSKLPLEHYCKLLGGQELVPNLSWSNFPKDTAGFVVFAVVNNRNLVDDPKNIGYNQTVALSTSILPVSTNFISTGEDITKTIPGAVWGTTVANEEGWLEPCQKENYPGDTITFKVFAVNAEFKAASIDTMNKNPYSYSLWNPTRIVNKYNKYILAESSFTVKVYE